MTDVMDTLAGIAPGSALAALRAQRPEVVRNMQASDEAVFAPRNDGGFTRPERAAAALRIATLLGDKALEKHYRERLAAFGAPEPLTGTRGAAILAHVERLTRDPDSAAKAHIDALLAAGLTPHAVLSLSQLIAYVNFQARVLAGLRMLGGTS
jgi:uncharacterized protein YciW